MNAFRRSFLLGPAIASATLLMLFVAGEIFARILLPSQQTVEIGNVKPLSPGSTERRKVEGDKNIDSVFEWGHQGIRLRPSINAVIRNHILSHRDISIDVNSLGLRYDELGPKEPHEFRVLVLGDSITIGDYVQYAETYPAILESLAANPETKIRFINGGIPGASLSSEIYRYLEVRDSVLPDLILVGMYLNDSVDSKIFIAQGLPRQVARSALLSWIFTRLDFLRAKFWKPQVLPPDISEDWKETFRAGRELRSGDMLNDPDAMDFEVYNAAMDFGLAWNPRSWEILETQLFALKESVESAGGKLAAFLLPVHFQVKASIEEFRPQRSFLKMCRSVGIPCFDTLPGLRKAWGKSNENFFYDHCHYKPEGNKIVAELVYDWLRSERLLP